MWHLLTTSFYFVILIDCTHTLWYALIRQGLHYALYYGNKVRTILKDKFGTPNLALYALAPNHVFGQ